MGNKVIIISNSNELVRVKPERVVYIESDGNYSTMVLHDKMEHVFAFECSRREWSMTGGATYLPHFSGAKHLSDGTFWLCPVTLFVLGEYPDAMWVEPLKLSRNKMVSLGLY